MFKPGDRVKFSQKFLDTYAKELEEMCEEETQGAVLSHKDGKFLVRFDWHLAPDEELAAEDLEEVRFECGDRVRFTQKCLEGSYVDPAVTEEELRGTVKFYSAGQLVVAFDDGTTNVFAPGAFVLIK